MRLTRSVLVGIVAFAIPVYPLQNHPPEKSKSSQEARVRQDETRSDNMVVRMMRRNQDMDKRMSERKKQADTPSAKKASR